ncbi:MAG: class I SAM-dependent methyltransferase [Cyclobacteriaceae bacterium]
MVFFYAHANDLHVTYNSICPNCNSRSRHRGLVFVYSDILKSTDQITGILHFAPEPIFYNIFKGKPTLEYQTADLFLEDVDLKEDIQNLTISDCKYDLVLSNHVIEHVPDDEKALSEMSRILRSGGKAIITIPGDFRRDKTIYFNHLRYNGHYRDYGLDVLTKLKKHYKSVEMIDMHKFNRAIDGQNHGIRKADMVFVCAK